MEPNESNLKPQPTGGLKLMTVFIAVLALHVVVIGGFTVWHLLYPSGTDADLTLDKTHKAKAVADTSIGDMPSDNADKTATPATPASSTPDSAVSAASTADATTTPPPAATDSTGSETPPATPTMTTAAATPAPATPTPAATPVVTEDASSAAANPPAATTPASHAVAATTPDNLVPPADAAASTTPSAESTADAEAPATTPVDGKSYSVKRGDSLAKIARRHHISLDDLRGANSLASDRLHIGQQLIIPAKAEKVATDKARATTDTAALDKTSTPKIELPRMGSAPVAQPVQGVDGLPSGTSVADTHKARHEHKLAAAGSTHHLYTVVKGDTLTKIAKRYHTTTSALVAANGLANAGRLSIGQKLHIPHESRGSATASEKPIDAEPHGSTRAQLANYVQ